jgi:PBSX family phage terminase large subunit
MSDVKLPKLTKQKKVFVAEYLQCFNGAEAARRAGYSERTARYVARNLLNTPNVKAEVEDYLSKIQMSADEALVKLTQHARANIADFIDNDGAIDWAKVKESGYIVKSIVPGKWGTRLEIVDSQYALDKILRVHGKYKETDNTEIHINSTLPFLPADLIAPDFLNVYRDIKNKLHTEYVLKGGRGSTKSSFVSLVLVWLLANNPNTHALVLRQVKDTLRDSVYGQIKWAINELGVADSFKCTLSPLEIEYLPTHQRIYFRGADDPANIKSIKPPFGHIGFLWFEELDQFHGPEAVRNIVQSALRGGEEAFMFKSFNPPRTTASWVNKYCQIPKANQLQHHSSYLTVPAEWLGKPWIEEAEHLKEVNPKAYDHEYMGIANGTGGQVFENVVCRAMTDDEIAQFDQVGQGIDWGYYPDPFAWGKSHFDANRRKLYIFDEWVANKVSNRAAYDHLVKTKGLLPEQLIIADSAEPKSVADFREYGANIRGAEKGPDSVAYSMKWLQGLTEIVIDPVRCPVHTDEFLNYELEQDKDGNLISAYPDKNNHCIDEVRYRTNLIWRRRGQ